TARLSSAIGPFVLARGMSTPQTWVIDDDSPNALILGRGRSGHLCVTSAALGLPDDELAALCAYELTALSCLPFADATAAIEMVLLAEWWTRVLWGTALLGLFSLVIGVPPAAGAGYALTIAITVAITRLALVV